MEDAKIIELYLNRDEDAVSATAEQYGGYLTSIALRILGDYEDALECVNDTYWHTWRTIPPTIPKVLRIFLAKIARNIAFDRYKKSHAAKRVPGNLTAVLEELEEVLPAANTVESHMNQKALSEAISEFLWTLPKEQRQIFVRRYWYCDDLNALCEQFGYSQSKMKSFLFRTRNKMKVYLEQEGIEV